MESADSYPSTSQILAAVEQLSSRELEQLLSKLIAIQAERRAPHLTAEESAIFARINQALPPEQKERLRELAAKREDGALTEKEREELIGLTDRLEEMQAERLGALAELARLRGTTLSGVMDQLGISFPDHD